MRNWTIFLDLDDTLVDTSERHYRLYKDVLQKLGGSPLLSKEEFWSLLRSGQRTINLLPANFSKILVQEFMDEVGRRIEDVKYLKFDALMSESLAVLGSLQNEADLVLVTLRHNRKNLFWELEQFHLLNYFKEVLYDSRSLKDKSPLIFKYLKKAVKSEKMVLIGDSEADLTAGKNLGLITIAFTDGIRSKEVLSGLEPDFFVDHLSQVLDLLERM